MSITVAMRTQVSQLYVSLFGRAPDGEGLGYWVGQLAAGKTVAQVAQDMFNVTAARAYYPSFMTNGEIVAAFYVNVLGRTADAEGQAYWVGEMNKAGATKGSVIADMINAVVNYSGTDAAGVKSKALFANKVEVAQYYGEKNGTVAGATAALAGVTEVAATVTTAKAAVDAGANPGQTFMLTAGADNFVAGAANDTFNAANAAGTAAAQTFNNGDVLNGGAGTDTLNVTVGAANTYSLSSVSNIENVVGSFSAAGTLTLLGATGINSISANASTAPAIYSNIASTAVGLTVSNTDQNATFTFGAAAVAGLADTATLTLSNVTAGTVTIAGVETLNVVSTGGSNALTALTAANATTINISGDQTLNLGTNTVATTINSTNTLGVALTSNNAAAVTIAAGTGNDAITLTEGAALSNNVSGGAGNDTITFTANLDTGDTVAGGDGTDILVALSADLAGQTYTRVSGFETLRVSDALGADLSTATVQAGISTVEMAAALAAARAITLEAGSRTVTQTATQADNLTVNDTGSATTDTLTLNIASAVGAVDVLSEDVIVGGFETVNINTTTTAAATQQMLTITVTPDTGGAVAINFTGNNSVTTGVITATAATAGVVNASGLTGTATFTNAGATVGITSITGTANADTIVGSATATTLIGGGGIDNITGGAAADSISGGTGNDVIDGAGGNDVITGEDGDDAITSGAGNDNINGGAGNDTITMGAEYTTGDVIDGGDGTDTMVMTTANATTVGGLAISAIVSLNNALTNVERLTISDAFNVGAAFDMARMDSINYVTLAASINGDEELSGLVNGTTVVAVGAPAAATDILTLTLSDATGSADALNYTASSGAGNVDFGVLAVTGTETLNLSFIETTADAAVRVSTLGLNITTATAGTTVNISGTETATIDTAIAAQTITSTTTGAFIMTNATGSSLNQTITSGGGADTIYGGGGADTINAGAGADSINGGTGADNLTGGTGADTINGGAGNDTITLTETTAAVDDVVINYSEAGANVDTVIGFTTTSTGDELQFSLAALEAAGTSGIHSAATNFQALNADTDAAAAAGTVQVMSAAAASANAANIFVLSGTTFSSLAEMEDAIETGGSRQIGVSANNDHLAVADAFMVVWTDGSNAYVSSVRITVDPGTTGVLAAGGTVAANLVTLTGVTSIGATTFAAGNFEWIA